MTEKKTQHTPIEWSEVYFPALKERQIRYYADGVAETIAVMDSGDSLTAKANAKFICKACNSHEALLEALKLASGFLKSIEGWQGQQIIDNAIKKAEEA